MKRYARSNSCWRSMSRLITCDCVDTSSELTGSSHTRSFGIQGECPRDGDALALPARELVRVAVREVRPETDRLEEALHVRVTLLAAHVRVHGERLADALGDRAFRIEGAVRVLEHHLHRRADLAQILALEPGDVVAVEVDLAGGGFDEPEQRPSGRRLARPALTDETERLARRDLEADPVDGLDLADGAPRDSLADRELLAQAADDAAAAPRRSPAPDRRRRRRATGEPSGSARRSARSEPSCRDPSRVTGTAVSTQRGVRVLAARVESAALRHVLGARHRPGNHAQVLARRARPAASTPSAPRCTDGAAG